MTNELITVKDPNIGYIIFGVVSLNLMLVPCGIGWLFHISISNDEITPFWTICSYYGQMTFYGFVVLILGLLIIFLLVVAFGIIAGAISGI